ncbi:glucose-6-phosphate dehydrogenase [bacterium]|nr:glucose-6-phosphate dehydrogenase [bacterium]
MSSVSLETNPLREGLSSARTAAPCTIVIFGASGDLTERMLIPSLFSLSEQRLVPPELSVLGISRRPYSDGDFRSKVNPESGNATNWESFSRGIFYMSGNHHEAETFARLKVKLEEIDHNRGTQGNRLFYLAVAPDDFPMILSHLSAEGLLDPPAYADPEENWVRIILEKPFGVDLASATKLNKDILRLVPESKVYRIDHYLGKETVQNILAFRFANCIFEPVWNRRYIDHIQITAAEALGVEDRAGYYDHFGAFKDMVQNHLLQLLALVAMEPPASSLDDSVRDEKVKVFKALRVYKPDQVSANVIRAQYGPGFIDGKPVPGYLQEKNVTPDSRTETYAAARFWVDNWRWEGVPFYLRTGKRLARKVTEIAIVFKPAPLMLFAANVGEKLEPNFLVLRIGPDEGISLRFGTKIPGMTRRLRWVNMDFDYGTSFARPSPPAYARLLHDCMIGDPTLYNRGDAVELAWHSTQPILDAWAADKEPIPTYEAGREGPRLAETWMEDEGRYWRKL